MNIIGLISNDRRLLALVAVGLLALVLGLFAIPASLAVSAMTAGGYWAILGTFAWFVWVLYQLANEEWPWTRVCFSISWGVRLLIICSGFILLIHETYGFKILMDEVMLLGTSMSMHFDKYPVVPLRGHDLQGAFQLLDGQLDKRPLFQPFLVSMLHDVTGYRPENVFVLNTVLTFTLLGQVYYAGRKLLGREAGIVAVLLLASLPLLAQNATGGGFELLNLVMIMSTLLFSVRFAEKRDVRSLHALILSAVLLAQTRYESILFMLPVGLLILWAWWVERRPILSWGTVFMPMLFIPVALHQKIFTTRAASWELASQAGFDRPFSLSYAPSNFAHWLNFFFDTTGENSNSLVLSALGLIALPFLILSSIKILGRLKETPPVKIAHVFFTLGFMAHTLLLLFYFWGRFDDPVIRRLSLPLNLWLVLTVVTVSAEMFHQKWIWRALMGLTGLGIFAYSLPSMSRHDYSMDYYVGREMEWRREFMAAHPEKDYLFIDPESLIWITHLVSGTPVQQALEHKDRIIFNFRNRTFTAFYVFQRFDIDPDTGRQIVQKDYDLGPDYQLATYWERRFTPLTVSRISRIVAISDGATTLPEESVPPLEKMSSAERDKVRQEYFDQLIRRLP